MSEFTLNGIDAREPEQFLVALGLLSVAGKKSTLRFEDGMPVLTTEHDTAEEAAADIAVTLHQVLDITDPDHVLHENRGGQAPAITAWRSADEQTWARSDNGIAWNRMTDSSRVRNGSTLSSSALWMPSGQTNLRAALSALWKGTKLKTRDQQIEWIAGQLEMTLMGMPTAPSERGTIAYISTTGFDTKTRYGLDGSGFIKVLWEMLGMAGFRVFTLRSTAGMKYRLWSRELTMEAAALVLRSEVKSVDYDEYYAPFRAIPMTMGYRMFAPGESKMVG